MKDQGSERSHLPSWRVPPGAGRTQAWAALVLSASLFGCSCSNTTTLSAPEPASAAQADAPIVAAQPGAWFDAYGNLSVVGAGRRLRLVLSAPISACGPALARSGSAPEVVAAASLPFHVLSDACRETHPAILLAEESDTASPAELERSYHEVARCAAADFGLVEGWIPSLVAESDPCPLALGLGWRLPRPEELQGLSSDDRKAVAGALFDTGEREAFGGLLVYARSDEGALSLVTLSPNAAEHAPALDGAKRRRPFFGAALRCVKAGAATRPARATLPVLPRAAECLREQRKTHIFAAGPSYQPVAEVQRLRAWLDAAERAPADARDAAKLRALSELLASPALERIAREARDERALTERYAELAEGLDEPSVSPAERERRRAEFDSLRKRLGGQIVQSAQTGGGERTALAALLSRLRLVLEAASKAKGHKKSLAFDYAPLLTRVSALAGDNEP